MLYSTILVAYDGSDHSQRALAEAANLCEHCGGKHLYIAHVSDPIKAEDPAFNTAARVAGVVYAGNNQDPKQLRKQLRAEIDQVLESRSLHYELIQLSGKTVEELLQCVKDTQSELLVVGSRGLQGLAGSLLGSVSSGLIREASIPVLVVK